MCRERNNEARFTRWARAVLLVPNGEGIHSTDLEDVTSLAMNKLPGAFHEKEWMTKWGLLG